jgi:anti-sigma factor RsiW
MRCPDKKEWITGYAAGELDRGSREELEGHLTDCPSCRDELAWAMRLEELLEQGSPIESPHGLVDRIMATIDREEQESLEREVVSIARERKFWLSRRDLLPSLSFAFAVILISVGLGLCWPSFYESLATVIRGASELNVDFGIPKPEGGVEENLGLIITGFMMLSSLLVVLGYMFPVRLRRKDTLMPF